MPKKAPELTAVQVRRLTKPGFYAVGGVAGLHLSVGKKKSKDEHSDVPRSWILRYAVGEVLYSKQGKPYIKRRDLGLGPFPDVGLQEAREKARKVKEQLSEGIDPLAEQKAARAALRAAQAKVMTFAEAAHLCHQKKAPEFKSNKHAADWINSLNTHAMPVIGRLSVGEIEMADVLRVLEPIWQEKTETATRIRQRIEAVMAWAIVSGYRTGDNPARWEGNLKEVLPTPSRFRKVEHFPALPWQQVPSFMADLRQREGSGARALEFLIYTAARSGPIRSARWSQIDMDAKTWSISAEDMKSSRSLVVPLSDVAVALLKALPHREGLLFPAPRGGQMSDATISKVIKRMHATEVKAGRVGWVDPETAETDDNGKPMMETASVAVPHGMRSSFKDWARNSTRYADEVSELQLAHVNSDATRSAYARDQLLPKRAKLMQEWAQYLAKPVESAGVVPIGKRDAG